MDRLVDATSSPLAGARSEAAGDVDTLSLDKTGTITLGNRQAIRVPAVAGVSEQELADAAQLSSLADETPEGPLDRRPREETATACASARSPSAHSCRSPLRRG